jgi:molecular chaperone HtpG
MAELITKAEQQALKSTELPAFEKVALSGLKTQVAEMLNMIGRTNEIFATYTKHDISHINAMLKHLDWLIPPLTQKEMTPVDWLLITLAIYFHDLGMLVTAEEFENRMENAAYTTFLDSLTTDSKSQDYLGRAKKMLPDERDRFFFQEFIREQHAGRIKEWITGRHSRHWGTAVKPITEAIADLMKPFPTRFRENLATVCESHHRADLNKTDVFPLCQRYGSEPLEMANVQYAALILRTVDLIHVTKDRTPSIMYKTIKLSDPKGVDEWDKQKDTFAVRHAGRAFVTDDESTHVITIGADFTEERPFFALTEYLSWADIEIKQTKRWSDQSRAEADAKNFWFPWKEIRGDLRVEGNEPQQMRFEFDRGRLLDLLVGHAIYNDATVAIRELLQNAIDAVRFRHHLDIKEAESTGRKITQIGKVSVTWNADTRQLVVEDTGTGMDLDIIRFHLMRVGSSFYDTPQFATEYKGFTPISRFGIGILTCFMISDDIEIVTVKSTSGFRIRMSSVHADYLLRELPLGEPKLDGIEPHGTRITLLIREGIDLTKRSIEDILRYWIIMPECKVEYIEVGKEAVKIGFDSPHDALSKYYEMARKDQQDSWKGIEIKSKNRVLGGARYEMAIAVQAGWFTEKTFARQPRAELPAVCIEGIRVSSNLPGFDERRGSNPGAALVSIRGERRLRTTVSRSDLEQDDEYKKLMGICADMLMDHIKEEIDRISSGAGKPLSRASTAGKWLSYDLMEGVISPTYKKCFAQIRRQLPLIVMEKIEHSKEIKSFERILVSPDTLEKQNPFWNHFS